MGARVPLVRGTGELIEVFSIMKIEFDDGKPAFLTMCMKEYDPYGAHGDLPFFEPTLVRLRPLPPPSYATSHVGTSPSQTSPMGNISVQEIYSPDSSSPTMMEPSYLTSHRTEPRSPYPVGQQAYFSHSQPYYPPSLGHSSHYDPPLMHHAGHQQREGQSTVLEVFLLLFIVFLT